MLTGVDLFILRFIAWFIGHTLNPHNHIIYGKGVDLLNEIAEFLDEIVETGG